MADKDLLVVISEMLRKQDEHSELIRETNNTLKEFMGVSIKQFEEQHIFNQQQQKFNQQQQKFNHQQQQFNQQQQQFNKQFLEQNNKIVDRLESIEQRLVHFSDMSDRIRRLEDAVFK